jgi:hypothetical protein
MMVCYDALENLSESAMA